MEAYRARMTETIEFSIKGDCDEDIMDYIHNHSIQEVVYECPNHIKIDFKEELITPIMKNSICEVDITTDNSIQVVEDVKHCIFGETNSSVTDLSFVEWVGDGHSFIVGDYDGTEYVVNVSKKE